MLTNFFKKFTPNSSTNTLSNPNQNGIDNIEYENHEVSEKYSVEPEKSQSQKKKKLIIGGVILIILAGLIIGLCVYFFKKPSKNRIYQRQMIIGGGKQFVVVEKYEFKQRNIFNPNINLNYSIWKLKNSSVQCEMGNLSYVFYKKCNNKPYIQYMINLRIALDIQIQKLYGTEAKRNLQVDSNNLTTGQEEIQELKNSLIQPNSQSSIESLGINSFTYNDNLKRYTQVQSKRDQTQNRLLLFGLFRPSKTVYQNIKNTFITLQTNVMVNGNNNVVMINARAGRLLQDSSESDRVQNNCFSSSEQNLECINQNNRDSIIITSPL